MENINLVYHEQINHLRDIVGWDITNYIVIHNTLFDIDNYSIHNTDKIKYFGTGILKNIQQPVFIYSKFTQYPTKYMILDDEIRSIAKYCSKNNIKYLLLVTNYNNVGDTIKKFFDRKRIEVYHTTKQSLRHTPSNITRSMLLTANYHDYITLLDFYLQPNTNKIIKKYNRFYS